MQAETLLKYYWDLFLSHLCEFHPLDKAFIEQYEYELDWRSLSKSKVIAWDTEFLERYEERFTWHELAWNDSILWTIDRIEKFKKRLDWYYLGRNRNLPITEEFIQKYAKKLYVVEDNPMLTRELQQKYKLRVVPAGDLDTQELKELDPAQVEEVLRTNDFYHNQEVLYKKVFLPIIDTGGLEQIFAQKFDYSQRYYFWEPLNNDISGLTPEFQIDGANPFGEFRDGRGLFGIAHTPVLKNGSLQEGPDRLYEVPRFTSFSYYATILISEHVKAVLEQFKLPPHIFHPVKLVPKKLTTATRYFILQLESDTLTKDLDYNAQSFYYSLVKWDGREHGALDHSIPDYEAFVAAQKELNEKLDLIGSDVELYPDEYRLLSDYDLYSYTVLGRFVINHFLKSALEKNFPGQMAFRSAQLLRIKIDQQAYDAKAKLAINTKVSSRLTYKESEEDQYYYAKMERLEVNDRPLERRDTAQDKFSKKEEELNVLFPATFKNKVVNKTLTLKGYKLLPISKYYTQNEYADRYPETYKSVVIAENGVGDSVALMLERNSDHQLQDRLIEFFHETGEYEEL